ncbi:LysR family transcriptional regulator [Acidovorax sp. SUPP3434]|uniref:LysR family transcriptional regulator n=1 Tax=Acidovorax sp. SUPP3434 TaxID=2920880 RepID=UPI0023DE548C|nr:LysR family transcriptional regulator [Acidovorax sp. SUPP3434]GKT02119.1 LysR family transcriptional regulator [Acidovorax sp. SUPP3434]
MDIRHLRCFATLAEELHFGRAAERLHIEQSPLSRTIKELEEELGAQLFDRDRRGTRLTRAGDVFLQDVRRVFVTMKQACENARAVYAGTRGILRVAISDGAIDPRLSSFLACCREDEPEIEVRMTETSSAEQLRGLRSGDFDIGIAYTDEVNDGVIAEPLWRDPIMSILPARHPLLVHKEVALDELLRFPLVLCNPQICEGYHRALSRILWSLGREPVVVDHVSSTELMLALVAAGYGVGFMSLPRTKIYRYPNVVVRPLASGDALLTTYLLRMEGRVSSFPLDRFTHRLCAQNEEK